MIGGLGVIVLVSIAICTLLVLLVCLWILAKFFPIMQRFYQYLKRQMQYNALLRFVLQSTLKL